jgi:hypothetical protein
LGSQQPAFSMPSAVLASKNILPGLTEQQCVWQQPAASAAHASPAVTSRLDRGGLAELLEQPPSGLSRAASEVYGQGSSGAGCFPSLCGSEQRWDIVAAHMFSTARHLTPTTG